MTSQPPASPSRTQDELKALVGRAALDYVVPGEVVGVGTGSTVNHFIDALASLKDQIPGAVSSSEASTARLKALGIRVSGCSTRSSTGLPYLESKLVATLGAFPLPVEIIPMAAAQLMRQFAALGGTASVRLKDGHPLVTDNGQHILDVRGLQIRDPLAFETEVSQWPGVVTVGVFAHQKAQVCLLGTAAGVKTLNF